LFTGVNHVVAAGDDGGLYVWNIANAPPTYKVKQLEASCMAISNEDTSLACGSRDGKLRLYTWEYLEAWVDCVPSAPALQAPPAVEAASFKCITRVSAPPSIRTFVPVFVFCLNHEMK